MEFVWVNPLEEDEFEIPYGACIIEKLKKHFRIVDDDGKEFVILKSDVLRPMHPSCVKDVGDMIKMGDLQEYSVLRNLQLRYKKNLIYTYTGNILIAVNPYQPLPLYGQDYINMYRNKKLGELPPHLFAIGDSTYENMRTNKGKQCIIINGESGAGKTQSALLLLQYYAAITGKHSDIEPKILMSNTILEAFGNAKTIKNDNSSRFGKYICVNFNCKGKMERARIRNFLLEKSRIVTQCKGERNYHIFYMLLEGLSVEEKSLLGLKEISFYGYLAQDDAAAAADKKRIGKFQNFMNALKVLNFSDENVWNIFQLLAAILHFGNISYTEEFKAGIRVADIVNSNEVNQISLLLGVPIHYLKSCLTRKTIATVFEEVKKELNKQEAVYARDAFVKAIYGNLFNYIANKINEAMYKHSVDTEGYIGILDVFGFENLKSNSFEQLCINLANEHLQQFFISHTFKIEQNQYREEGIYWECIDFTDNTHIIDMLCIEPMNIVDIINDQSKFPGCTDESLLDKLIECHKFNKDFLTPKFSSIQAFGINHFAGVVLYDVKDFLEKNRDSCTGDFLDLARLSDNSLLQTIFSNDVESNRDRVEQKKKNQATSVSKFKNSLDELISELHECHPFFVRCIKPNDFQKPNLFKRRLCCQQLRHSGIWETSKIRQAGYSVRYSYREFVLHYKFLKPCIAPVNYLTQDELRKITNDICYAVFERHLDQQFGLTRVFLKNSEYLVLEKEREKILSHFVVILQTRIRAWICRKRYVVLRRAAIVIQKFWRGRRLRRDYLIWKIGLLRLQASIRARYQRISYIRMCRIIKRFQARCKGYAVRRKYYQCLQAREKNSTTVKIQAKSEEKSYKPAWKTNFTKGQPVRQDSYLHGRSGRVALENISEVTKFVDDSFDFLN